MKNKAEIKKNIITVNSIRFRTCSKWKDCGPSKSADFVFEFKCLKIILDEDGPITEIVICNSRRDINIILSENKLPLPFTLYWILQKQKNSQSKPSKMHWNALVIN